MNISGINFESIVDGDGVRVVVYVSGCEHGCPGCHNPDSHDFSAGRPLTEELQHEIIRYIQTTPFVSGLTVSGGDPVYSASEVAAFLGHVKAAVPDSSIWLYSGFSFEEIVRMPDGLRLLEFCDVLVDGEFEQSKKSVILPYRGSTNQRIIDIKQSLSTGAVVEVER